MKRKLACPIKENLFACGERRCGCGWPESPCRDMWPETWALQMLRKGLWNEYIRGGLTTSGTTPEDTIVFADGSADQEPLKAKEASHG